MRWLERDPIEESGGLNLYGFCRNDSITHFDKNGCAFFAVRKLSASPFSLNSESVFSGTLGFSDRKNTRFMHEHLFFQDGKSPKSIGYTGFGTFDEEYNKEYVQTSGGYNDCVMRIAINKVSGPMYSLLGSAILLYDDKFNCQDYADELRRVYNELCRQKEIRCKCFGGK